jgi:hypothetical protein
MRAPDKPVSAVLRYQAIGLGVLITAYWSLELPAWSGIRLAIDIHTAWDQIESVLLTFLSVVIAIPIGIMTHRLVSRVGDLEERLEAEVQRESRERWGRNTLVARLGDGNLSLTWRLARDVMVQSVQDPDRVGRVLSGRAYRSPSGRPLEEYEIEREDGVRFLARSEDLRVLPLCEGQPMRFNGTRTDGGAETLLYRCPECQGTSELLL